MSGCGVGHHAGFLIGHTKPVRRGVHCKLLVIDSRTPRLRCINGPIPVGVVGVLLAKLLCPRPPTSGHTRFLFGNADESIQWVVGVSVLPKSVGLVQRSVRRWNPGFGKAYVAIVVRAALSPQVIAAVVVD